MYLIYARVSYGKIPDCRVVFLSTNKVINYIRSAETWAFYFRRLARNVLQRYGDSHQVRRLKINAKDRNFV